jgi:hypothetical protein
MAALTLTISGLLTKQQHTRANNGICWEAFLMTSLCASPYRHDLGVKGLLTSDTLWRISRDDVTRKSVQHMRVPTHRPNNRLKMEVLINAYILC